MSLVDQLMPLIRQITNLLGVLCHFIRKRQPSEWLPLHLSNIKLLNKVISSKLLELDFGFGFHFAPTAAADRMF